MKLAIALLLAALASAGFGQAPGKAEIFSSAQIREQITQFAQLAREKGSSGITLGNFGTHALMLSERTANGKAEVHTHFDDIMLVVQGQATLISGGEVIDPHNGSNGEIGGSGIRNGVTTTISSGDLIHIPAGTPHQLLIEHGVTYSALVIKVKE